jgi:hypothetical protein
VFGFGIWGGLTGTIALGLELQDRYSKWQKRQSTQSQTEQVEVSTSTTDITEKVMQYSPHDNLK